MQMNKMLMVACQNGQKGIVDVYLKKGGIDINGVDDGGFTALHYACNKGAREIVKMLLDYDADVNCRDMWGKSALHYASNHNNSTIIELLLNAGAQE